MKKLIFLLSTLLLVSNAFWIYQFVDTSIAFSYQDQELRKLEETQKQLMAVMPELAKKLTKAEVLTVASKYSDEEPFEKDGCTWVGGIGLKFTDDGNLHSISPLWSYGEEDPCNLRQ